MTTNGKVIEWSADGHEAFRDIQRRYKLRGDLAAILSEESHAWAQRRIADDDAHGYTDEPRHVCASDVQYAWAYLQLAMP